MMIENFRFESSWVLLVLPVVAVLFLLALWRQRKPGGAVLFPSLSILPGFGTPWRVRLAWLLIPLRAAAVVLVVVALARPQIGQANFEVTSEGIDIALVVDTSFSMRDAGYGGFSKMEGAKRVVREFLGGLKNDRVGIVLFSGEAVVLAPLTIDYRAMQRLVDPIEAGVLAGGTAIGTGIATGLNVLRESDARSKVMILLTDGENNSGEISPLDAANLARLLNVRTYVIGAVTESEARSPRTLPVDERLMQRIAESTGARYYRASDPEALLTVYREIEQLEKRKFGGREYLTYDDVAHWLLIPAAALFLVELLAGATIFRRLT